MIDFPIWCRVCNKVSDATADPVAILFGPGNLIVTCSECETEFNAVLELHANGTTVSLKEEVTPDASE